jgi:ketosteroid isomerase-like protein
MAELPRRRALALALVLAVCWMGTVRAQPDQDPLSRQVADTERAFARSMAERNHAAFTALLSEQAVFFDSQQVHRGKAAVAAAWKGYFGGPKAPFSWEPDQVQVLADGTLALSTGPVRDASGKLIARFNSIWRQEAPGVWRIVFDKGQPPEP